MADVFGSGGGGNKPEDNPGNKYAGPQGAGARAGLGPGGRGSDHGGNAHGAVPGISPGASRGIPARPGSSMSSAAQHSAETKPEVFSGRPVDLPVLIPPGPIISAAPVGWSDMGLVGGPGYRTVSLGYGETAIIGLVTIGHEEGLTATTNLKTGATTIGVYTTLAFGVGFGLAYATKGFGVSVGYSYSPASSGFVEGHEELFIAGLEGIGVELSENYDQFGNLSGREASLGAKGLGGVGPGRIGLGVGAPWTFSYYFVIHPDLAIPARSLMP